MSELFPSDYDMLFKIVLLGDPLVGKSYILSQYIREDFDLEQKTTIGVEFDQRMYLSTDKTSKILVQLWDTAGQEKFISTMPSYFRSALGVLLVFDVTKQATFTNCKKWMDVISEFADPHAKVLLVGNKTDLNNLRIVSPQEASTFAASKNIQYFEVSALTSQGIQEAVSELVEEIKVMVEASKEPVQTNKSVTLRHRVDVPHRNQCCGTGGMV